MTGKITKLLIALLLVIGLSVSGPFGFWLEAGVYAAMPSIWITEIMPNSTTPTEDLEGFEFIELYNNNGSSINLSAYKFRYYYNYANQNDYYDYNMGSFTIPAYSRVVVWTKGTQASSYTLAQFAEHYNLPSTYLTSSKIYALSISKSEGLGNAGEKTVELMTDTGTVICRAKYNDGTTSPGTTRIDTTADTSIIYAPVDGSLNVEKLASTQYPTPSLKYNWFGGQQHSHSVYSDGTGTPQNAYSAARNNGADFFALTDHSEQLDDSEWTSVRNIADSYNDPYKYTALAGFEMTYNTTTSIWGHANIFNSGSFIADRWDTINGVQYSMHDLWDDLEGYPDAIVQFNHPDYYWGDFEDFEYYTQAADDMTALFELNNDTLEERYDRFLRALEKGWHVAPAWSKDNHSADWMADDQRTVVLAESNTRAAIIDAIKARRVYASYGDKDVKVMFSINGHEMGSKISSNGDLNVSVIAANPTADNITKISLFASGGQLIGSQTYSSRIAHYTLTIAATSPQYQFYYAIVEQGNGDWAATAPIWITNSSGMELTMSKQATETLAQAQVNANVKNISGGSLTNVLVEFFKDDFNTNTDNYISSNKVGEVIISSIAAGATATANTTWCPTNGVGTYRILVRVSATVGGVKRAITGGIHMPELYITEIVANSPGHTGVDDGWGTYYDEDYDFIEIFNNAKNDVNLKYFKIQDTYNSVIDITADFIIPSKQSRIVWFKKKNSTKTVTQFNAAYGTSIPSANILQIQSNDVNSGLKIGGTTWIDIIRDGDGKKICRAKYNNGTNVREVHGPVGTYGADPSVDGKAIKYRYPVDGSTLYLPKSASNITPTPGSVTSDQIIP